MYRTSTNFVLFRIFIVLALYFCHTIAVLLTVLLSYHLEKLSGGLCVVVIIFYV